MHEANADKTTSPKRGVGRPRIGESAMTSRTKAAKNREGLRKSREQEKLSKKRRTAIEKRWRMRITFNNEAGNEQSDTFREGFD